MSQEKHYRRGFALFWGHLFGNRGTFSVHEIALNVHKHERAIRDAQRMLESIS